MGEYSQFNIAETKLVFDALTHLDYDIEMVESPMFIRNEKMGILKVKALPDGTALQDVFPNEEKIYFNGVYGRDDQSYLRFALESELRPM